MNYSTRILAKIGREVIENHPVIASSIIEALPVQNNADLSKIPEYFESYCAVIEVEPAAIKQPVFKSSVTEVKKVFIAAMATIYNDQWLFKTTISDVLNQDRSYTGRMIEEVTFRYKKEQSFQEKVNNILQQIINTSYNEYK